MSGKWWLLLIPLALVLLPVAWLFLQARLGSRPPGLGVSDGSLRPCPDSPNCVSTQTDSREHRMEPWPLKVEAEEAPRGLEQIVRSLPRAEVVTREGNYLHAEFTSGVFRFVDDVEFVVDPSEAVVHFRSASRVGYSDLGVNRARMERIGRMFADWQAKQAADGVSENAGTATENAGAGASLSSAPDTQGTPSP